LAARPRRQAIGGTPWPQGRRDHRKTEGLSGGQAQGRRGGPANGGARACHPPTRASPWASLPLRSLSAPGPLPQTGIGSASDSTPGAKGGTSPSAPGHIGQGLGTRASMSVPPRPIIHKDRHHENASPHVDASVSLSAIAQAPMPSLHAPNPRTRTCKGAKQGPGPRGPGLRATPA